MVGSYSNAKSSNIVICLYGIDYLITLFSWINELHFVKVQESFLVNVQLNFQRPMTAKGARKEEKKQSVLEKNYGTLWDKPDSGNDRDEL